MPPVLRDYQLSTNEQVVQACRDGYKRILIQLPTGCHAYGQGILLFSGSPKPVQDISVGDLLMGPDSNPRTVLSVIRGNGRMYKITPVKGDSFIVNEDHVLTLCRTRIVKYNGKKKRSDAKNHIDGNLIDVTVKEWLEWPKWRKHIHKLIRTGVDFPAGNPLRLDPYLLGVILGDGSIGKGLSVTVTNVDSEIVSDIKKKTNEIGLDFKKVNQASQERADMWILSAGRGRPNQLLRLLEDYGLRGTNFGSKFIPKDYLVSSRENRLQLLAGLLDTDGSLSHNGFDFISKSQNLSNGLAFVARSLGMAAYVSQCEKRCQTGGGGTYWRVSISGNTHEIPCRLSRKRAPKRLQKKSVTRTGFTVQYIGTGDYFGFTLSEDGRYLLDDFTITHNSGKTNVACDLVGRAKAKFKRVLVLAHRRKLVEQFSERLDQFEIDHSVFMRGVKQKHDCLVTVASKDTLASRCINNEWQDMPPADVVIVDECRHAVFGEKYRKSVLDFYISKGAYILGLDATPVGPEGQGLGPPFEKLIVGAKIHDLIEKGFLLPIKVFRPARTGRNKNKTKGLAGDLVGSWKEFSEGLPTVLFTSRVAYSEEAVNAFMEEGIKAVHVDAKTPDAERERIFDMVANGEYQVLCNVGICGEGVDIPCLGCCQLYMDPSSRTKFLQQIGRIMRPHGDQKYGILIDHAGSVFQHGYPDEDTPWTLEGNADAIFSEKHKKNQTEKVYYCENCQLCYTKSNQCPQCGMARKKINQSIFAPPSVDITGEILIEDDRKEKLAVFGRDAKISHWFRCLQVAKKRGGTMGMAAQIYKSKYKEFPKDDFPNMVQNRGQWRQPVTTVLPNFGRKRGTAVR